MVRHTIIKEFYQKYLFDGYKPTEITVLTFRKTAAADLIGATISYARIGEKELKQHVGTIHSICYRLIGHPEKMEQVRLCRFCEEKQLRQIPEERKLQN